jgi:hypothetical protein
MLISIPYDWIPLITRNLNEMQWIFPAYTGSKEEFLERERRVMQQLYQE